MKLIYVYDALCGWCYGFSPVISQFKQKYFDDLSFEVISGGMITGHRVGPVGEVAPYISWAYKEVEKASGVRFGSDFLDHTLAEGSAIFTSVLPAIALSVFKEMDQGNSLSFAADLQRAIYYDGIPPKDIEAYGHIASMYGIEAGSFVLKMKQPKYNQLAEEDFKKSAALQVSGFPAVFIERDQKYYQIASGYMPLSALEANYQSAVKKIQSLT